MKTTETKEQPGRMVFAIGNVLDPRILIQGGCRNCYGTGRVDGGECPACGGVGLAQCSVRLSDIITPSGLKADYVGFKGADDAH